MVNLIEIKTIQPYFDAVWDGEKNFEIRLDDRNYKVGDILWQREYYPEMAPREISAKCSAGYTERSILSIVTYKIPAGKFSGLAEGYCAMQCEVIKRVIDTPLGTEIYPPTLQV